MTLLSDPSNLEQSATIAAARITADATVRAGWVQACAAAGAILAGALAYFGAVRQVRLQERAHEARAVAYRFRMSKVVTEYLAKINQAYETARRQLVELQDNKAPAPITSFSVAQPPTLHDENWEVHALLGPRAVELILVIDETSSRLASFDSEIRGDNVRTDTHFASGTLETVTESTDGRVRYEPKRAIVDYVDVLGELRAALIALRQELARAPHVSFWRKLRHLLMHSQPRGWSRSFALPIAPEKAVRNSAEKR